MAFSAETKRAAYERAGGRCECLRQSCTAHDAGRCGCPLADGWHAHPVRARVRGRRRSRQLRGALHPVPRGGRAGPVDETGCRIAVAPLNLPTYLYGSGPPVTRSSSRPSATASSDVRVDADRHGPVGRLDLEPDPAPVVRPPLHGDEPAVRDVDRPGLVHRRPSPASPAGACVRPFGSRRNGMDALRS